MTRFKIKSHKETSGGALGIKLSDNLLSFADEPIE
jgi:hypothetical protein